MQTKQVEKTIYITSDNKEFTNEFKAKEHEQEVEKEAQYNKIINMNNEDLNWELINTFGLDVNNYTCDLDLAIDLINKMDLLYESDAMLYKNYDKKWCIGELKWEYINDIIIGDTIEEVIYKFALLKKKKLL